MPSAAIASIQSANADGHGTSANIPEQGGGV